MTRVTPWAAPRWRLHWDLLCWRYGGLLPGLGVALWVALLLQLLLPPRPAHTASDTASLTASARAATPPVLADAPPAEPVHDALGRALRSASLHDAIAAVASTAQARGLDWSQAEYRREQAEGSALVRWRIGQSQHIREAALRDAVGAVLREHPHVSLDRLRVEREARGMGAPLQVRLDWSLWLLDEGPRNAQVPVPGAIDPPATARALFATMGASAGAAAAPTTQAPVTDAPVAVAPPLPYRYLGLQRDESGEHWILERERTTVIAREGDMLHEDYRLERAEPERLWLTHLPTGTRQPLPMNTPP